MSSDWKTCSEEDREETARRELTAAAALTSLVKVVNSPRLPHEIPSSVNTPTEEKFDKHGEEAEEADEGSDAKDCDFQSQFTKSGRKRAIPFPVKVSNALTDSWAH